MTLLLLLLLVLSVTIGSTLLFLLLLVVVKKNDFLTETLGLMGAELQMDQSLLIDKSFFLILCWSFGTEVDGKCRGERGEDMQKWPRPESNLCRCLRALAHAVRVLPGKPPGERPVDPETYLKCFPEMECSSSATAQ